MIKIPGVVLSALIVCVLSIFMSAVAAAQDEPPEDEDVPVVVSRDESTEQPPADRRPTTRQDVRESADRNEDTIVLPPQIDNSTVRTSASPYNINLNEAQQKLMLYLDILTKTESRAEGLRTKLFELLEKENQIKSQISQIEYSLRPEQIQNAAALSGSLRPEEIRDDRQRILQAERSNLNSLLRELQRNRRNLEAAVISADRLVERVRAKFEGFVDKALEDEIEN